MQAHEMRRLRGFQERLSEVYTYGDELGAILDSFEVEEDEQPCMSTCQCPKCMDWIKKNPPGVCEGGIVQR